MACLPYVAWVSDTGELEAASLSQMLRSLDNPFSQCIFLSSWKPRSGYAAAVLRSWRFHLFFALDLFILCVSVSVSVTLQSSVSMLCAHLQRTANVEPGCLCQQRLPSTCFVILFIVKTMLLKPDFLWLCVCRSYVTYDHFPYPPIFWVMISCP